MDDRLYKMKLGRRAAYLRRCVLVVDLLGLHETNTSIRKRVFEIHIQPVTCCSYATFNNMLNEPNPRLQLESVVNELKSL